MTLRAAIVKWCVIVFAMLSATSAAHSQNALERLVNPGELIKSHAKFEKDCASCHKPFSGASQKSLCLDCHKDVAADIDGKKGFHGLRKDVTAASCNHCHTDHKGRNADIIQLDVQAFDHSMTDFALTGSHTAVKCEDCHRAGKHYRDAPLACMDCHKNTDPHGGSLGEKCETCHDATNWRKPRPFDHDTTKFKLTGGHVETGCKSCHAGERWGGISQDCVACHRAQDKHQGKNGNYCDSCHKTVNWTEITFNHDKDTKFPLLGKHLPAKCESCHQKAPKLEVLATTCMPCHSKEDVHKGGLGKDCQKCHNESGWKIGVLFNHDKDTKFPLLDKHVTTKCADCHTTKDYREAPKTCVGCHAKKDAHLGRLGPKCEDCHNARDWKVWTYDHAVQARYPLTGKHAGISCYACHKAQHAEKVVAPNDCNGCHQKDDVHHGAFGKECGKCHTTKKFTPAFVPR